MTRSVFTNRYDTLRLRLIEARKIGNLKQSEVALKLNRPQSFVSKYERGERRLDVIEFLDVCGALALSPHRLIEQLESEAAK